MTGTIFELLKKEAVTVIAVVLALVSMIFVPPNGQYLGYIDFFVLGILFSLMVVVAGFKQMGVLDLISYKFVTRARSVRILKIILVNCVFFSSMFFTNDVALIALVPITIGIFKFVGPGSLISTIVLETIAANMGSMMTPIGNPQNLYLYSFYHIAVSDFLKIVLPVGITGYIILMGILAASKKGSTKVFTEPRFSIGDKKVMLFYLAGLFILCILAVLHIVDYRICFVIVLGSIAIVDRGLLKKIDYGLLLTFVAFFIFVGNLDRIDAIKKTLPPLIQGRVFLMSVLSSQVISNVPAAMMVSRFTGDAKNVLLGVNVGGLGTLVASLASVISFKLYAKSSNPRPAAYLKVFTIYNVSILIVLILAVLLIY
ncbi:MAG: SLC13 family permease [Treponema sp.]|nr:SLC13 family permease [Treponema sp.]